MGGLWRRFEWVLPIFHTLKKVDQWPKKCQSTSEGQLGKSKKEGPREEAERDVMHGYNASQVTFLWDDLMVQSAGGQGFFARQATHSTPGWIG